MKIEKNKLEEEENQFEARKNNKQAVEAAAVAAE